MCIYISTNIKIKKYARTCVYKLFPNYVRARKTQTTHLHMEPLPAPLIIQPVTRQISRR